MKYLALLFLACFSLRATAQEDSIQQRIILIGDAGEMRNGINPVVDAVRRNFKLNEGRYTVLFLGDNVYPLGLPSPLAKNFPEARAILDYQVNLVRGTEAKGIFVPGNHDWSKHRPDGWRQIRNQQQYIDSLKLPNVDFLPKDGCPGPLAVPLGDDVMLIVMDSEWWLYPGAKPGLESSCDQKTEDEVLAEIKDIAAANPGKLLVFAAHHPLRSHGIHGGYYTIKQHIFPLTDAKPYLYVPMPVIGSVYPLVRGVFGTREDLPHPLYKRLIRGIEGAIPADAPTVFVAGHEHTLQLINEGHRYFLVSGAGAKDSRVKQGPGSLFASKFYGYSVITVMKNGKVKVDFYNENDATPIFSHSLFDLNEYRRKLAQEAAKPTPSSVTMAADPRYEKVNGFHRFMLGENYRKVWNTPLNFPVIDIDTVKGGLKVTKRGGGMQTRSLRLEDSSGREWVLRSLVKNPTSAVPEPLRETFAREIVQDQISASNPYAPLVVSSLAEKAGVPHTNPAFVYLPDDTALGIFRQDFANGVYLFEEREPVTASKTYNTLKVLEKLLEDNDNSVDQTAVLQARLLDFFIGDWDRHDDQWRWWAETKKKRKIFNPIPRDRDQAFFVNEGLIPRMASRAWLMPNIQGFRKNIPNINGLNFNPRYFDRNFLTNLSEEQWSKQSVEFSKLMTDDVIETAIRQLPDSIRQLTGPMMLERLKARREILQQEALKYYRFLAKGVDVTGSQKNEQFTIDRLEDGKVRVTSRKISKSGDIEQKLFDRTFDPRHTREVAIYGLGGEDRFILTGDGNPRIRVRLIGGPEKDTYIDSVPRGGGKKALIYDLRQKGDSFAVGARTGMRLSSHPDVIRYNRMAFKYNKLMPLVTGGFNLDDGLLLGLGMEYTGQGFRKDSFAVRHRLTGMHALATEAWQFRYEGQFNDVVGKSDLLLHGLARAPHNTVNFFGFGNETEYDKNKSDPTIRYYRSRFDFYSAEVMLRTRLAQNITFAVGPSITAATLEPENNYGRFLDDFDKADSARLFANKSYAGLRGTFSIDTRDNKLVATRGLLWNTSVLGSKGLTGASNNMLQVRSDMSIYASLGLPPNVVLVTRLGGGYTWGNPEFFQALSLGGTANLRGFRNNRFSGHGMFYNNMELRIKLFDFTSYILPGSVGMIAFNDVGRVWLRGEDSGQWHNGFGGGLYFSPVNLVVVTAVLGHSSEGTLPYVTFGFKF
ncbi:BamA/TamA family outer membrane protein [Chitinophaga caseinilytica]|uniref:BamA/TamA family outer membrane protein n=1 Tax=Chitinophaga caseinilytica TaxID=2267521 RepID=UPI003C2E7C36